MPSQAKDAENDGKEDLAVSDKSLRDIHSSPAKQADKTSTTPTPVAKDVVAAYSGWMLRKKKEIEDYYKSASTPAHYKHSVKAVFDQLDKDGDGSVELEELLLWAAEKNERQGNKVPDEFIVKQFLRVDLDGNKSLDFEECLLMQYLGCLNMLWCDCCGTFIDADKEDGYTCKTCYGKIGKRDKPGDRQQDLCIKCYEAGQAQWHIEATSSEHVFVRLSEVKEPETIVCACCGTEHGMVLGYMQGEEGDRHVRPLPGDPDSWLCELCALTSCKCGQKFAWKTDAPVYGQLFADTSAPHEEGCPAGQAPRLKDRWIASSEQRRAPPCKTCREALAAGTMPFPVEPPPAPPADTKGAPAVAAVAAPVPAGPSSPIKEVNPNQAKQVVCYCCQELHDMTSALDGSPIKSYMYASGFPGHVSEVAEGKFLCEWCVKYACEKCGAQYADPAKPKLGKWSCLGSCPAHKGCEPMTWGGLSTVREKINEKAEDLERGHCRTCRLKIIKGTLPDVSKPPGAPSSQLDFGRDLSSLTQGGLGGGLVSPGPGSVFSGMSYNTAGQQMVAVCVCCQEAHDITTALDGSRVPAYIPKDDFPEHTLALDTDEGEKFLCEWCSKWVCNRCGAVKWTNTRYEIGLWSMNSFYCKNNCQPKEGVPRGVDRTALRVEARDHSRPQCRTCRDKIMTGKLVDRAQAVPPTPTPPPAGMSSKGTKKWTDVSKVLGKGDDKSCSIQ